MLKRIIARFMLLPLVVMLLLGACAGPTQTSTPALTPAPAPTLESTPAPILTLEPSANPAFKITDLAINPPQVSPGERAIISANLTNTGDTDDSYTVELFVNDIAEIVKEITIPAGETRELRFSMLVGTPGTYKVALGELTGQLVAVESSKLAQSTSSTPARCSCCGGSSTSTETEGTSRGCCGGRS